jgi:hypothetical protein
MLSNALGISLGFLIYLRKLFSYSWLVCIENCVSGTAGTACRSHSLYRQQIFLFSKTSTPALRPTQSYTPRGEGKPSPGVKQWRVLGLLDPCRRRQCLHSKCRYLSTALHHVASRKARILNIKSVETSHLSSLLLFSPSDARHPRCCWLPCFATNLSCSIELNIQPVSNDSGRWVEMFSLWQVFLSIRFS